MGNEPMVLRFERLDSMEGVRERIRECEGRHSQQVAYSTFHDCLTQICYGCGKVRSNVPFMVSEAERPGTE